MEALLPRSTSNPSLDKLWRDLEEDAALLRYLPYKRATFELQNEIPEAAPERLLYGDMLEKKDQLWIYFTLNSHHKQRSNYASMLTFQTIEGAAHHEASVRPGTVQKVAQASKVFKHAQGYQAVEAVAKYFFIQKGIDKQLQFPVSSAPFRDSLVRVCQHYKEVFDQLKSQDSASRRSSIMTTGGNHGMDPARLHGFQEPSRAASEAPFPGHSSSASSMLSPVQSRLSSRAMSHGSSRAMSLSGGEGRKRRHSASPDQPQFTKHRESHTQPGRSNAIEDKAGGFSSYSQPPSPFLVTATPPLPEHTLEENMEEAQVNESNLESEKSVGEGHLGDIDRNTMMDQYIALKAQEEELDGKIGDMEMKRANIADQVAELQADMNAIDDRKGDLEEEKARVRAEKRKLQIKLDENEHLDFGFEAGRRMEAKRQRME